MEWDVAEAISVFRRLGVTTSVDLGKIALRALAASTTCPSGPVVLLVRCAGFRIRSLPFSAQDVSSNQSRVFVTIAPAVLLLSQLRRGRGQGSTRSL